MNTRAVSAALLVSLLWASGAGGRGSPKTWVEATATTPSCTLDVVLVTFKDATRRPSDLKLNYHLHDRPYGTNPGQSSKKRYQLKDFERLFTGGYGTVPAFSGSNQKVAGGNVTLPEGVRQCAGVFRFHVPGSPRSSRGKDERQVSVARARDQCRQRRLSPLDRAVEHQGVLP